jgi:hypothetical protein
MSEQVEQAGGRWAATTEDGRGRRRGPSAIMHCTCCKVSEALAAPAASSLQPRWTLKSCKEECGAQWKAAQRSPPPSAPAARPSPRTQPPPQPRSQPRLPRCSSPPSPAASPAPRPWPRRCWAFWAWAPPPPPQARRQPRWAAGGGTAARRSQASLASPPRRRWMTCCWTRCWAARSSRCASSAAQAPRTQLTLQIRASRSGNGRPLPQRAAQRRALRGASLRAASVSSAG